MPVVIGVLPCHALADYLESVRRAGAEPRVLNPGQETPEQVASEIDGLLLPGGPDIDPQLYGEARDPSIVDVSAQRDEFELALVRLSVGAGVPTLGLCRGLQVLNVAFGGTLIQDISSQVPGALGHKRSESPLAIAHDVWISPQSQLGRAMAESLSERSSGERGQGLELSCGVNSRHHQAAKRVAEGFVVSATAPDGIVEAIERPASRFCLGVQWHPENFWRTGEFRPLFEAFVSACAEGRG